MKIGYLREGFPDCPIVRLYDFCNDDLKRLRKSIGALVRSEIQEVCLQNVAPIESLDGTNLTLTRCTRDRGVIESERGNLNLILSADGWIDVACRLKTISEQSTGYQWLWETGDARVLLSKDGRW